MPATGCSVPSDCCSETVKDADGFYSSLKFSARFDAYILFINTESNLMAAAAARALSHEDELPAGKVSVLYAEDQTSSRVVTTALMRKLGYDVDAVEDGELALQKAMVKSYDIILLDIEMPVMDGVTAARRIRNEAHLCKGAPILAMSAYLADTTENSTWRRLFDCALPKPASSDELKMALLRVQVLGHDENETACQVIAEDLPLIDSFRSVLPKPMWMRLAAQAADDMQVLALTAVACADAGDPEQMKQSLRALKGLARSFEAHDVVAVAAAMELNGSDTADCPLPDSIAQWLAGITR
jgi:CheY-like chemotaxis protein